MANNRAKMPIHQRAKQFMPFDAVVGLRSALKEKEKIKEKRKIPSEDLEEEIDQRLKKLKIRDMITINFYNETEENYNRITGSITDINPKFKKLKIGERVVNFKDIFEIKPR